MYKEGSIQERTCQQNDMYLNLCPVVSETCKETILEVNHAHSESQYVKCQLLTAAAANLYTHT